ncbi:MAG: hypothetical protein GX413_07365 [Acetobacter sp.]|nr:hypothetical protein [Acetobacter sp.]
MRLDDERQSDNIDDRRGASGGGSRAPLRIGSIGGLLIVLGALYFGVDPRLVMNLLEGGGQVQENHQDAAPSASSANDAQKIFTARILASTEDVWSSYFQKLGKTYHDPKLVLFTGGTTSGCGYAQTATGPFYCPADQKVYLDIDFFRELQDKLGAGGDFARAYVIAHEIGHHVQNELGIFEQEQRAGVQGMKGAAGASVRTELQADCFAGVWARRANDQRNILEKGDVEEGLAAAAAVGDDRLQKQAQGYVVPDSFTHGTSAQRVSWFRKGMDSGDIRACDTFGAGSL